MKYEAFPKCLLGSLATAILLNLLLFATVGVVHGQEQKPLTNADVLSLVKQKLATNVIEAKIRSSSTSFDTSIPAIIKLGKQGVPDSVVALMVEVNKAQSGSTATAQSSNSQNAVTLPKTTDTSLPLRPKRRGVPRIGIVTTQSNVPIEQDEAVRAQFYELIYGNRNTSTVEAVLLREKLDRNIASEALQTKCDYILFVNLESTIRSAADKQGNFIQKAVKSGAEAIGAANKMVNPLSALTGITYRSFEMADSLSTSMTLLESITTVTKKKDKIQLNFRLVDVLNSKDAAPASIREIIAKQNKEPIFQNLLIQVGNDILNTISSNRKQ